MFEKIKKYLIIFVLFYIFYQLSIGTLIRKYENFFEKENRREFIENAKNKILNELNAATKKDQIFSDVEREIISKFIKKIKKELDL